MHDLNKLQALEISNDNMLNNIAIIDRDLNNEIECALTNFCTFICR